MLSPGDDRKRAAAPCWGGQWKWKWWGPQPVEGEGGKKKKNLFLQSQNAGAVGVYLSK